MATIDDVDAAERLIDAAWGATTLPADSLDHCLFELLSFAEGHQAAATMSRDPNVFLGAIDEVKFTLRHALLLAHNRLDVIKGGPYAPSQLGRQLARSLLQTAGEFNSATLAFSLYRKGEATCHIGEHGALIFKPRRDSTRYEMLDMLVSEHTEPSPLSAVMLLLRKPRTKSQLVRSIGRGVKITPCRRLHYSIDWQAAMELQLAISPRRTIIPQGWRAWGVDAGPLRAVLRALQARCAYHAIAIHRGAAKFSLQSAGLDHLVLVSSRQELASDLAALAHTEKGHIETILGALTFGKNTRIPDPALQPIIGLAGQDVAIPCYLALSSNIERNLFALQTRISSHEFSSHSSLFEKMMIEEARRALRTTTLVWITSAASSAGEIDLIIGDRESSTAVLVELKWTIQAADVDEVVHRRKTIENGVRQALDKSTAVMANGKHYAGLLGLRCGTVGRVVCAVACRGFADEPSDKSVPCIPFGVMAKLIKMASGIDELALAIHQQAWLPVAGVHYEKVTSEHGLGGVAFTWEGCSVTHSGLALGAKWSG